MNQSITVEPVAQITIAPLVRLVDIHGDPVPDCERHTPVCDPDPTDPADWPSWTDNFRWETDEITDEDIAFARCFDDAMERLPALPDLRDPHDWPDDDFDDIDQADLAAADAALEDLNILPIAGGAPEPFEPSAADILDYTAWAAELDARRDQERFYAAHPLSEFNRIRSDVLPMPRNAWRPDGPRTAA